MQKDRWLSLLKEKVRWLFQTVSVKNVGVFFYIPIVMWSHLHFTSTTCILYQQIVVPSPVFGFSAKNFCRVWLGLMFRLFEGFDLRSMGRSFYVLIGFQANVNNQKEVMQCYQIFRAFLFWIMCNFKNCQNIQSTKNFWFYDYQQ